VAKYVHFTFANFPVTNIYIETDKMNDQYLEPDKPEAPKEENDDTKLRAIIKKYSCQTKIYNEPRKFWWESAAYERYNR